MTKLCARGKSAAKRKFKVYPSAYANAYASKICAGKIKDPSGTKRKDWGPKKANKGLLAEKEPKSPTEQKTPRTEQQDSPKKFQDTIDKAKKFKNKKPIPGDPRKRRKQLIDIQNPISEYDKKGKLTYTGAKVGMNVNAGGQSAMGRLEKSGMRGVGIAIKGTSFKGVF